MGSDEVGNAVEAFCRGHDKMQHGLMTEWARGEVAVLGWDIRDCVALLRDLHTKADLDLTRESRERLESWPIPPREQLASMTAEDWERWHRDHPPPPAGLGQGHERVCRRRAGRATGAHLATALVLVRAYQDGVARVLNFAINNAGSGKARMTEHLGAG